MKKVTIWKNVAFLKQSMDIGNPLCRHRMPFEHTRCSIAVGGDIGIEGCKIPLLLVVARAPTRRRVWASGDAGPFFRTNGFAGKIGIHKFF